MLQSLVINPTNCFRIKSRLFLNVVGLFFEVFSVVLIFLILGFLLPYKLLVYTIAKIIRPDLTSFVHNMCGVLAADKIHDDSKPTLTLQYFLVLNGHIPLSQFRSIFETRILNKVKTTDDNETDTGKILQQSNRSNFVYSRFQQHWTHFMGYNFWKWDHHFQLENHIVEFPTREEGPPFTRDDLPKIMSQLLPKPFPRGHSPWEILLLYNYQENRQDKLGRRKKMVIIFRVHHALADGFSLLNVIQNDLPLRSRPVQVPQPNFANEPIWKQILVRLPILMFEISDMFIDIYDSRNSWLFPRKLESSDKPAGEYYSSITTHIDVSKIRAIKNKYGVSYFGVLVTVVLGGIRQAMERAGQPLPERVGFMYTRPRPNHPGGLVNHWSATMGMLPMNELSIESRLKIVEKKLSKDKVSAFSIFFTIWSHVVAWLPTRCIYWLHTFMSIPAFAFSNFPVSLEVTSIEGCQVTDFFVGHGSFLTERGVMTMMFGDGGKQSIVVSVDQTAYSSQADFEQLATCIRNELNVLESALELNESYHHGL